MELEFQQIKTFLELSEFELHYKAQPLSKLNTQDKTVIYNINIPSDEDVKRKLNSYNNQVNIIKNTCQVDQK